MIYTGIAQPSDIIQVCLFAMASNPVYVSAHCVLCLCLQTDDGGNVDSEAMLPE